jgi:hypothetical protein
MRFKLSRLKENGSIFRSVQGVAGSYVTSPGFNQQYLFFTCLPVQGDDVSIN